MARSSGSRWLSSSPEVAYPAPSPPRRWRSSRPSDGGSGRHRRARRAPSSTPLVEAGQAVLVQGSTEVGAGQEDEGVVGVDGVAHHGGAEHAGVEGSLLGHLRRDVADRRHDQTGGDPRRPKRHGGGRPRSRASRDRVGARPRLGPAAASWPAGSRPGTRPAPRRWRRGSTSACQCCRPLRACEATSSTPAAVASASSAYVETAVAVIVTAQGLNRRRRAATIIAPAPSASACPRSARGRDPPRDRRRTTGTRTRR